MPEKTETLIGSELYAATPTSWDGSEGSPMMGEVPDFGMNRTRPVGWFCQCMYPGEVDRRTSVAGSGGHVANHLVSCSKRIVNWQAATDE